MTNISSYIGDGGGHGHELKLVQQDDGTVLIMSHNPDTGEDQRVVLLEQQWRLLLCFLLQTYGRRKCCFFRNDGICDNVANCLDV